MSDFSNDKTYALFDTPLNRKRISELGQTVLFPTIATRAGGSNSTVLQNLDNFDWLIFTDVYTVEYFVMELKARNLDLYLLDDRRVLAFGEAVADRLRFSQLHADVIPSSLKVSDVLQALKDYVFDELINLKFLVLKKENATIDLVSELSNVTELPIYSVEIADETAIPKLKALLKGGAIDEFIFSSHYDVLNLGQIFQTDNLAELLSGVKITATDESTLQSLQEFRLVEK